MTPSIGGMIRGVTSDERHSGQGLWRRDGHSQIYLQEIKDDALLTACRGAGAGRAPSPAGMTTRERRMIQANLRAWSSRSPGITSGGGSSLDDLIGEGNLGLIRATEEFDPRFGTRFSTYASYWIKQAIRHALINTTATIRLPAHMVGLLTQMAAGRAVALPRAGPRAELRGGRVVPGSERDPEDPGGQGPPGPAAQAGEQPRRRGRPMVARGIDRPDEAPDAALEAEDERRILLSRLERLDDRERTILSLRYGLEGEPPLTLKEIGRRLGVTREWVRKIELRAVRKLDPEHADNPGIGSNGLNPARATRRSRSAGPSQAVAPVFSSAPVEPRSPVSLRSRSFRSAARLPAQPGVAATPAF